MKIKSRQWVVVADGSRGLVLVNEGTALEPKLHVTRTYGQDNPKTSDQGRDKPPRTFESTSPRRSAAETPDLHQRAEDQFVTGIMAELAKDAAAGAFQEIVIAAPPVALGTMRKAATKELAARIVAWIDKDLTKEPVPAITAAVAKALEGWADASRGLRYMTRWVPGRTHRLGPFEDDDGEMTMATASDLKRIAMSLEGTLEAPHFDRTAFKVWRIYATLAPDKKTANLMLTRDEQDFKCLLAPEAFAAVPNAWGRKGATTVTLAEVSVAELRAALEMAWKHAASKKPTRR
jgi:protein required for attachment to host cells